MRPFLAALRFLSFVPVPQGWTRGEDVLGSSVPAFPLVGLLAGGVLAALAYGLQQLLPALPAAALVVVGLVYVSRAMHLEGVADTADGFLSSRPRERVLEIMKDSHTGAMGVIAVALLVLLKVSLLAVVPGPALWRVVLLTPLAGRCALVVMMALLPYARPGGGLATVFAASLQGRPRRGLTLVWAVVLPPALGWLLAGWMGLTGGAVALAACLLFIVICGRRIGGYTGDTLGAACELAELAPALVAAAWA